MEVENVRSDSMSPASPKASKNSLTEVGVENRIGRGLNQMFLTDRLGTLGPSESLWSPTPPPDPTPHQVDSSDPARGSKPRGQKADDTTTS